jgi:hypothetical protein
MDRTRRAWRGAAVLVALTGATLALTGCGSGSARRDATATTATAKTSVARASATTSPATAPSATTAVPTAGTSTLDGADAAVAAQLQRLDGELSASTATSEGDPTR